MASNFLPPIGFVRFPPNRWEKGQVSLQHYYPLLMMGFLIILFGSYNYLIKLKKERRDLSDLDFGE